MPKNGLMKSQENIRKGKGICWEPLLVTNSPLLRSGVWIFLWVAVGKKASIKLMILKLANVSMALPIGILVAIGICIAVG